MCLSVQSSERLIVGTSLRSNARLRDCSADVEKTRDNFVVIEALLGFYILDRRKIGNKDVFAD